MQSDHPAVNHLKNALSAAIAAKDWPMYDSIIVDVFMTIQAMNERMQARRNMVKELAEAGNDDADLELEKMPSWILEQ